MSEEDIQRKIDAQLAHLRNEFNEKYGDLEKRYEALSDNLWKFYDEYEENVIRLAKEIDISREDREMDNYGALDAILKLKKEMKEEIDSLSPKKPKPIVRYYFRVPNEKNAFKRIFSLAYQLTESKCVEAPIEEGEPLYVFIRDFLDCFSGAEIDFPNEKKITWLKEDNLAIYLIDKLRDNKWIDGQNLDIKIENIFGIKNPAQKRSNYFSNNKERRPKNHYIIDDIIEKVNKLENYNWSGEVPDFTGGL